MLQSGRGIIWPCVVCSIFCNSITSINYSPKDKRKVIVRPSLCYVSQEVQGEVSLCSVMLHVGGLLFDDCSLPKHCKFNWVGNKTVSHLLNLSLYNVLCPCTILLSHHHGCKNRSKSVLANGSSIVCDPSLHGKVCCITIILDKRIK